MLNVVRTYAAPLRHSLRILKTLIFTGLTNTFGAYIKN